MISIQLCILNHRYHRTGRGSLWCHHYNRLNDTFALVRFRGTVALAFLRTLSTTGYSAANKGDPSHGLHLTADTGASGDRSRG